MTEIAKAFLADARGGPQREQRIERLGEAGDVEPFGDDLVEPRAFEIAADIERVIAGHAADDADIAGIRSRATVRAAGDADAEPLALEPPPPQSRRDRIDDVAAHPLGLGQGEAAARQSRARQRPALDRQQFFGECHAMRPQNIGDRLAVDRIDLAEDDVLARHQDRIAAEPTHDVAQRGAQPRASIVDDAAAGDRQAEIKLAVALSVPAEMVGHCEVWHRPARFERLAEIFRQAFARPFLAALGDDVFETRMAAIAAIAPVAVQPHHGRGGVEQIIGLDKGDRRCEAGIGLRLVVRHAVTAAEEKVVPGEALFTLRAVE